MTKKLALAMLVVVALAAAWRLGARDAADDKLVFDRFWIDREPPRTPADKFKVFFVSGQEPFGRFVDRTPWTGAFELFHYHMVPGRPGSLDCIFGHTSELQRLRYAARPCHERGFDYCLELAGTTRGVQRYYSMKDWGARSVADVDARIEALAR